MVKSRRNVLVLILSVVFAFALISFVAARPVSADGNAVTMKETASVRLDPDGRNGIRFSAYVSDSVTLDEDTFAGIIVAKGNVEAPTIDDDVIDVKAERFDTANNDEVLGRAFNAVIWDIAENNANAQELTARAYVCDNGEYSYSENVCVRSLAQVASKVIVNDNPPIEDLNVLQGYVDGANPVLKIGDVVLSDTEENEITMKATESATITVEPANIAFKAYADVDSTALAIDGNVIKTVGAAGAEELVMIDLGTKFYMVKVVIGEWSDSNIKANVLADYDEAGYVYTASTTDGAVITWLDAEQAKNDVGADSGVLRVTSNGYKTVTLNFKETINVKECGSLYLRVKHNLAEKYNNYTSTFYIKVRVIDANGEMKEIAALYNNANEYASTYYKHEINTWTYWTFSNVDFTKNTKWAGVTEISAIDFYLVAPMDLWIDEIGYTTAGENVISDFNESEDIANVVGSNATILMPGDEGYPADLGATSGVLKVDTLKSESVWQYAPENVLTTENLSKIILRIYIPVHPTYWNKNVTIHFYVNDNEYSKTWLSFARGSFVDVEYDVSATTFTTDHIYKVGISRAPIWTSSTVDGQTVTTYYDEVPYYIDSISVVYNTAE